MTARIISFASPKGGSGKTVISASLATFLAGLGKRILLVDMDAATNGLSIFYVERLNEAKEALAKNKTSPRGVFEAIPNESLTFFNLSEEIDFIPATYRMKQVEDMPKENLKKSLLQNLDILRSKYDYILIDAQAGSDIYAQIAMEIADEVVIVSEYDPVSIEGIERLKRLFGRALSYDKTWVLFNKMLPVYVKSLGEFLSIARFLVPIPWDAEVVRAYTRRRLAVNMKGATDHTIAIMQTARSLFAEKIDEAITNWKKGKEEALREPVHAQLTKIEQEISILRKARGVSESTLVESKETLLWMQGFSLGTPLAVIVIIGYVVYTYWTSSFFFWTGLVIAGFGTPLVVINWVYRRLRQIAERRTSVVKDEVRVLDLRLDNLKERVGKLRILANSDLETLLKKD